MAGLVGWVAFGEFPPLGAGPEDPEDAVQDLAIRLPRTTRALLLEGRRGDVAAHGIPLLFSEIHIKSGKRTTLCPYFTTFETSSSKT